MVPNGTGALEADDETYAGCRGQTQCWVCPRRFPVDQSPPLLWPPELPDGERTSESKRNIGRLRDPQHICTALRNGEQLFVTRDGEDRGGRHHRRGVLDSAAEIERRGGLPRRREIL